MTCFSLVSLSAPIWIRRRSLDVVAMTNLTFEYAPWLIMAISAGIGWCFVKNIPIAAFVLSGYSRSIHRYALDVIINTVGSSGYLMSNVLEVSCRLSNFSLFASESLSIWSFFLISIRSFRSFVSLRMNYSTVCFG